MAKALVKPGAPSWVVFRRIGTAGLLRRIDQGTREAAYKEFIRVAKIAKNFYKAQVLARHTITGTLAGSIKTRRSKRYLRVNVGSYQTAGTLAQKTGFKKPKHAFNVAKALEFGTKDKDGKQRQPPRKFLTIASKRIGGSQLRNAIINQLQYEMALQFASLKARGYIVGKIPLLGG